MSFVLSTTLKGSFAADDQAILLRGILQNWHQVHVQQGSSPEGRKPHGCCGISEDEVAVKREVTLVDGEMSSLIAEPVYGKVPGKRRPSAYSGTSFEEGIKGIRLKFNDRYN